MRAAGAIRGWLRSLARARRPAAASAAAAALVAAGLLALGGTLASGEARSAADAPRATARVPLPVIEPGSGDRCVEDTPTMRRNHMEMLQHHRDRTVREGIRTTQHSLANCVTCHASRKTGRVTGDGAFCSTCHSYAGVRLDSFECHADRPQAAMAEAKPAATGTGARP